MAGHARTGGDASYPAHSSAARLIGVALTITRGDLRGRAQNFGGHHGGKHAPRESEPKFDVAAVFIKSTFHSRIRKMKTQGSAFSSRCPSAFEPAGFDLIFGKHPSFDFALYAAGQFRPNEKTKDI